MSTFLKGVLVLNLLIAASYVGTRVHAQRPPELDTTGAAYLRVNINATDIPPMVNINPYETVLKVEITCLPEIRIPASGCQNRQIFYTGIGRSISFSLVFTYLHRPQQTFVTITDGYDS